MKISYLIITCNKKNYLKKVLKERIGHLKEGDEIVVIDNGSTDGTKQMMKKYKKVRYFWYKNKGYCPATLRNRGLKKVKNECIIQGDDDVIMPDGYIETLLKTYYKNTLTSGAFCRETKDGERESDWRNKNISRYEKVEDNLYELADTGYSGMVCYNKSFALKIGGYDTDFDGRWGGEDTNFGQRWHYSGGKCYYVNKMSATHLYHQPRKNYLIDQQNNLRLLKLKLAEIKGDEKVAIIIHTFLRDDMIYRCVNSINSNLINCRLYISDAGRMTKKKKEWYSELKREGHKVIILPYDSNWTVGRNKLVKLVKEKYVLYLDDDFVFSKDTIIGNLLKVLKENDDVGVVGGKVRVKGNILNYNFNVKGDIGDIKYLLVKDINNKSFLCDIIANFWLAKTEIFKSGAKWDENLNIGGGHSDFFLNLKFNTKWKLIYSNDCIIDHLHTRSEEYAEKRHRTKWKELFLSKWNNGKEIKIIQDRPVLPKYIKKDYFNYPTGDFGVAMKKPKKL